MLHNHPEFKSSLDNVINIKVNLPHQPNFYQNKTLNLQINYNSALKFPHLSKKQNDFISALQEATSDLLKTADQDCKEFEVHTALLQQLIEECDNKNKILSSLTWPPLAANYGLSVPILFFKPEVTAHFNRFMKQTLYGCKSQKPISLKQHLESEKLQLDSRILLSSEQIRKLFLILPASGVEELKALLMPSSRLENQNLSQPVEHKQIPGLTK